MNIKLNPAKCVFGVPSGKLLGFLVSHRGIEENPDKIKSIEDTQPQRKLKDMQRLAGCMASLGRFISKFGERALPFFKIMKRTGTFKWTPEAEKAFEDLKKYLASPPVMVAPRSGEHLKLYLSATPQTVSAVLVVEREEPVRQKKSASTPKGKPPDLELDERPAPSQLLQEDPAREPVKSLEANPPEAHDKPHEANSIRGPGHAPRGQTP